MSETKPSEVLQSIADVLLGAPEVWTKNSYAKNAAGLTVDAGSPDAVRWCSIGLIKAAEANADLEDECLKFLNLAVRARYLAWWNDARGRTDAEVQAAFQKAADLARKEGN